MGCTWLKCDECGRDYLIPDAWLDESGYRIQDTESDAITHRCDRCVDLSGIRESERKETNHAKKGKNN